MVTNYPQQLAATESIQADAPDASVVSRVVSRLSQMLCGLSGHDRLLHFEGKRVMMRCTSAATTRPAGKSADVGRAALRRRRSAPSAARNRGSCCARPPEHSAGDSRAAHDVAAHQSAASAASTSRQRITSADVDVLLDAVKAGAARPEQQRRDARALRAPRHPSRSSSPQPAHDATACARAAVSAGVSGCAVGDLVRRPGERQPGRRLRTSGSSEPSRARISRSSPSTASSGSPGTVRRSSCSVQASG